MKKRRAPIHKLLSGEYKGSLDMDFNRNRIENVVINQKSLFDKEDYTIIFDTCFFKKCNISNNKFRKAEFIDCKLDACDLSNNTFTECTFIRCEFTNCRFLGTHFVESYLNHILIKDSLAQYLDVANCKAVILELFDTNLQESNWFDNFVEHLNFDKLDLTKSYIYKTPLKDVDLSSSNLESIKIDQTSIKGVAIASWQAEIFCRLLGIKVK